MEAMRNQIRMASIYKSYKSYRSYKPYRPYRPYPIILLSAWQAP